jgi:hypothetical protein
MTKFLFVTGNFGISDKFPICEPFGDHDFIMFTDNLVKYEHCGWTLKYYNKSFHENNRINKILINRYVKFQLHNIMDLSLYNMVIYCDGYMIPKNDECWSKYAEYDLVQQLHIRDIYDECVAIHKYRKDTKKNMKKMIEYFKSLNVPRIKMYENTAFCYNPSNAIIQGVMKEFWELYISLNITYRDQPLWSYVLFKNEFQPYVCNTLFSKFSKIKVKHRYV